MQMEKTFNKVDQQKRAQNLDFLLRKVVKCDDCHICCQNSSALVLNHEVAKLRLRNIPLQRLDSSSFISLSKSGRCPGLNEKNRCGIYGDRPISCRLFPFYLMNRPNFEASWVYFSFCPKKNRLLPEYYGNPSQTILRMTVFELERNLCIEEIEEMLVGDGAISNRDYLEVGGNEFIVVESKNILLNSFQKESCARTSISSWAHFGNNIIV